MVGIEPTSLYDYPSVMLTQAIDGEMSTRSWHPARMTVNERDSYVQRLKAAAGGGMLTDTLIDTVTNPWVILMALTSGYFKMPAPGAITSVGSRMSAFVRKNGGLLQTIGLSTGGQMLRGTHGEALLHQVNQSIHRSHHDMERALAPAYTALLKSNGLKDLDDNPRLSKLIYAKLAGMDVDKTVPIVKMKKTKDGARVLKRREVLDLAIVDQELLDAELNRYKGANEFIAATRATFQERLKTLFGREGGTFEVDPEKVTRVWRGFEKGLAGKTVDSEGVDLVHHLMGADIQRAVAEGSLSEADFLKLAGDAFKGALQGHYMPRNTYTNYYRGNPLDPEMFGRLMKGGAAIQAPRQAVPRSVTSPLIDTTDLDAIQDLSVRTRDNWEKARIQSQIVKGRAVEKDQVARVLSMNTSKAISRYADQSANTKAFLVDGLSPEVLHMQRETLKHLKADVDSDPARKAVLEAFAFNTKSGAKHQVWDPMDGPDTPLGGWSPADAMRGLYHGIRDPGTQNAITDVLLPQITGRIGLRESAIRSAVNTMQSGLGAFVNSPAGQIVAKQGGVARDFMARLGEASTASFENPQGREVGRNLANYLYGTHLGLNPSSVLLNLTQPLVTTVRLFGPAQGILLYGEAMGRTLKSMSGYMGERIGSSKVFITAPEKRALLSKHFPLASDEYDNVISVGSDALDMLDTVGINGRNLGRSASTNYRFTDLMLKMFDKAEVINRNVTGEMVRLYHEKKGMPVGLPGFLNEARVIVNETQFGGDLLNTPMLFMKEGSPLNASLARQFMSFPIRMASGALGVFPHMGSTSYGQGLARDFIRGMGTSAILYEAAKNVIGTDLERNLYAESVTDVFTRPLENVAPPVVSIPKGILDALTEGDLELLKQDLPRLLPAGVAVSKLMGLAPKLEGPMRGASYGLGQKNYVDWARMDQEGRVPVFKYDGTLVSYEDPVALVLKQAGFQPTGTGSQQELEGLMLRNREKFNQFRKEYLNAVFGNDVARAEQIKAKFKTAFGFELKVDKAQIKAYKENLVTPRPDRILNRLPENLRETFRPALAATLGPKLGMSPQEYLDNETAAKNYQEMQNQIRLDERTKAYIRSTIKQTTPQNGTQTGEAYSAFGPY